ncbi:MAG TPA: hypothetical protein VGM16_03205 [Gammaproteobacteria bacterium]|jgi:ABC-type nitrate/sulfonate/bicarbonate transport system substrate-binding protein
MRLGPADRELMARFAALSLPKQDFGHAEHVHLAWALLASQPLLAAMRAFRGQLQAFAAHHGATGLYNETITCFYLLLIRERMDALGPDQAWAAFRSANPDLFSSPKPFLERWYPAGAAFAPEAKSSFRLPA